MRNSIYFEGYEAWIYKKCGGIKERFYAIPSFLKCSRCLGLAWAKDGGPVDHVFCGNRKVNVVESFLYLEMGYPLVMVMKSTILQESIQLGESSVNDCTSQLTSQFQWTVKAKFTRAAPDCHALGWWMQGTYEYLFPKTLRYVAPWYAGNIE